MAHFAVLQHWGRLACNHCGSRGFESAETRHVEAETKAEAFEKAARELFSVARQMPTRQPLSPVYSSCPGGRGLPALPPHRLPSGRHGD